MHPLLRAVQDYLAGGARKRRIIEKYGEISNWDTSSVTDMYKMFEETTSFNHPLNKWNVSNVKNMHGMFANASSFNQPLNSWNVSNVTNMRYMFYHARSFNQPLNSWNVSNVSPDAGSDSGLSYRSLGTRISGRISIHVYGARTSGVNTARRRFIGGGRVPLLS